MKISMTIKTGVYHTLKTIAVIAGFTFFISCQDRDRGLEVHQERYDSLLRVVDEYRKFADSVQAQLRKREAVGAPVFYGKEFEEIENPEEYIIYDLRDQPEMINLDPVLGGTMEFREIKVLTREWILAKYDDGHIQGRAIYLYKLQPDGRVDFKVIASQHPE